MNLIIVIVHIEYWYCEILTVNIRIRVRQKGPRLVSSAPYHCQSNDMNNTAFTQCCSLATSAHSHLQQHSSNISLDTFIIQSSKSQTCGSISTFFSILCPPWDHSVFQIRHAVSKAEIFKFHDNGWRGRKNQNCGHGRQQGENLLNNFIKSSMQSISAGWKWETKIPFRHDKSNFTYIYVICLPIPRLERRPYWENSWTTHSR